jgi:hypothetical protein
MWARFPFRVASRAAGEGDQEGLPPEMPRLRLPPLDDHEAAAEHTPARVWAPPTDFRLLAQDERWSPSRAKRNEGPRCPESLAGWFRWAAPTLPG